MTLRTRNILWKNRVGTDRRVACAVNEMWAKIKPEKYPPLNMNIKTSHNMQVSTVSAIICRLSKDP